MSPRKIRSSRVRSYHNFLNGPFFLPLPYLRTALLLRTSAKQKVSPARCLFCAPPRSVQFP